MSTASPGNSRFRPGQSGNPKGRPRKVKTPGASAFDIVLDRMLAGVIGGVDRELTVEEALQQRIYKEAVAGKRMAIRTVLRWIERREAAKPKSMTRRQAVELKQERADTRTADEAMLLLGIASVDERRPPETEKRYVLLEPWAVQMALSRRTGAPLEKQDIASINRCTRDASNVRWPPGAQ